MRENTIEKHLRLQCEANGAKCWKFVSPGVSGVPDRIVLWPKRNVVFVETKAPGKPLRERQKRRIAEMRKLGADVTVIDTKIGVKEFIARMKKT